MAATIKLNKEGRRKELLLIGLLNLIALLILIYPFTKYLSAEGTALSFLLASIVPLPLAYRHLQGVLTPSIIFWSLQALIPSILLIIKTPPQIAGLLSPILVILISHIIGVSSVREFIETIKFALNRALLGR
jgi:hypothetical protein